MNSETNTIEQELSVNTDVSSSDDVSGSQEVTESQTGHSDSSSDSPQPLQKQAESQTSQQRHSNAVRRIQSQNKQLKAKLAEYEAEIQKLKNSNKPEDVQRVNNLLDKHETFSTIVSNNERETWEQEAEAVYGDNAGLFLQLSDKYGEYINTQEPEVCDYIGTKHGMLLLGEWMKRMEVPQYRAEWQQMPKFQKGQVLARFYEQIEQLTSGQQTVSKSATKPTVVPAIAGGTQTGGKPSADDLSGNIETAFAEFGYNRR